MGNRYNKVIEKIKVTPEMSERILENISKIDLIKSTKKKNIISITKVLSAACFIIVIFGAIMLMNFKPSVVQPPIRQVNNIAEYSTYQELCEQVDFDVKSPTELPKEMYPNSYTYQFNQFIQIIYSDNKNELAYRMAKGNDDISGDYNEYNTEKEVKIGDNMVTLKGNSNNFNLVLWTNNGYTFSISSTKGLIKDEISKIILSLK